MTPIATHPLAGDWTANLAKSRRHPNHQFQSATVHVEIDGNTVVLTSSGINMSGKFETTTQTFQADGVEHPIPQVPGVVSVCRWGSRSLEMIGRRGDDVLGFGTYAVSDDGALMTATVKGIDAQGASFEQVVVYDRD